MKKKIIIAVIFVSTCILLFLINLFVSASFFKNYYISDDVKVKIPKYSYGITETANTLAYPYECCGTTIEFKSLRSKSYLDEFIKDYIENLPTCYDESYFYDAKYGVTYSKYIVEDKGIYNKITITFQKGNTCKNVYTLDNEWLDIANNSKVTESTFNYKLLLIELKQAQRLDFNNRIPFDETNKYQMTLTYQKYGYTLYFTVYSDDVIGVTRIDSNETSKYALYNIGKDAKTFLNSL